MSRRTRELLLLLLAYCICGCSNYESSPHDLREAIIQASLQEDNEIMAGYLRKTKLSEDEVLAVVDEKQIDFQIKYNEQCIYFIKACKQPDVIKWHFDSLRKFYAQNGLGSLTFPLLCEWPTKDLITLSQEPAWYSGADRLPFFVMSVLQKGGHPFPKSIDKISKEQSLICVNWMVARLGQKKPFGNLSALDEDRTPWPATGDMMVKGLVHFQGLVPEKLKPLVGRDAATELRIVQILSAIHCNSSRELLKTMSTSKFSAAAKLAKEATVSP